MKQKFAIFNPKTELKILWVLFCLFGRLFPHLPNMTPTTNLCLFAGANFSKRVALPLTLLSVFLSDLALSYLNGYPVLSFWSLFTYSGYLGIALLGSMSNFNGSLRPRLFVYILTAGFGFWVWTNFGVWLGGGLYPKTLSGFLACFVAALPFLRNALVGDLIFGLVIFGSFAFVSKRLLVEKA